MIDPYTSTTSTTNTVITFRLEDHQKNRAKREALKSRVDSMTAHPVVKSLTASGIDVTRLELFSAQAETFATKNGKKAAPSLTDDYESVLRRFLGDNAASKEEWQAAVQSLRPGLEEHLRTLATSSWRGRGLPLPSVEARERYVQLAAKRTLAGLNDIRKRYNSATAGKAGRQSAEEYIKRAGQTTASIADRATDYLYQSYEKQAVAKGAITGKVWRNSDPAKSRHSRMEGVRVAPNAAFIDPLDGLPITPRQPRGGQKEFSGSNAIIRYVLSNGREV